MKAIESEQAVLGALMLDNDRFHDVNSHLLSADFYRADHRKIYEAISVLADKGEPFDAVVVANYLEDRKELENVGGLGYVASLQNNVPTANTAKSHAKAIREKSIRRHTQATLQAALEQAVTDKPIEDIIADTQAQLESVAHVGAGYIHLQHALQDALAKLSETKERVRLGAIGAPTGIPAIDGRTGGLHGPRLWCVAARPGLGKTAITLQWALNSAGRGHKVGICSLEMSSEELAYRAFANKLQVNMTAFAHADDQTVEIATTKLPSSNIKSLDIFLDTQTFALSGIVSRITEWKRKHGISYAIIDHVGLVEATGYNNRNDQLGHISRSLKKLCKRLDMPIVIVSQLNRSVEKERRRPALSDLRDSGNIEQDIDVGIFLHAGDDDTQIEIGLLKNRLGRKGWLNENFTFDGATQTFRELVRETSAYAYANRK